MPPFFHFGFRISNFGFPPAHQDDESYRATVPGFRLAPNTAAALEAMVAPDFDPEREVLLVVGEGSIGSNMRRVEALTRRELRSELPALFLAGVYLLAALFHLALYRRRPALRGYLWFGVVGILFAAYTFLRTQWKYALGGHFLLLKEVEHLLLYLMVPAFIELLWPLLGLLIGLAGLPPDVGIEHRSRKSVLVARTT